MSLHGAEEIQTKAKNIDEASNFVSRTNERRSEKEVNPAQSVLPHIHCPKSVGGNLDIPEETLLGDRVALPSKSKMRAGDSCEDPLVEAAEDDGIDDPPSSSALLFAKLKQPRLSDKDRDGNMGRKRAVEAMKLMSAPQTSSPSGIQAEEACRGHTEVERAVSCSSRTHLVKGASTPDSFPALKIDAPLERLDSHRKMEDNTSKVPEPAASNGCTTGEHGDEICPHVVIQPLQMTDSDDDPNADLSLEDDSASLSDAAGDAKNEGDEGSSRLYAISRLQEIAYFLADSKLSVAITIAFITIDHIFFLVALIYLHKGLPRPLTFVSLYIVLDIITAVVYFVEVNLRLFSYGRQYYFHSLVRGLDYSVSVVNTSLVLARLLISKQVPWLLIARYIRLSRVLFLIILRRERILKLAAIQELEELASLLETERSEQNGLIKWRIDSSSIAMGEAAGKGGFGAVFLGLFRGTLVAIKQLYQNNDKAAEYTSIEDEAVTLVNLRHPNVVLFMGFVHEPDKLWIVTEYCSRGSLRDLLDNNKLRLTQSRILKFALGAARGLAYLHGQDPPVLHLDLKSSNILISSGWDTKLADFGLSRNIDNIQNNTFAGTIQYSAPEILESNTFSVAADVYSFGICLWEMAARDIPFQGISPMEVLWGVVKEQLRPPIDAISPGISTGVSTLSPNSGYATVESNAPYPSVRRISSRLDPEDHPTETLIDAAVVVAAGSMKNAHSSRMRLSLPSQEARKFASEADIPSKQVRSNPNLLSPLTAGSSSPSGFLTDLADEISPGWLPQDISTVPINIPPLGLDRPSSNISDQGLLRSKLTRPLSIRSTHSSHNSESAKSSAASCPSPSSQSSLASSMEKGTGKENHLLRRVTRRGAARVSAGAARVSAGAARVSAGAARVSAVAGIGGGDALARQESQIRLSSRPESASNETTTDPSKKASNNGLDELTSKLTAKIQLLDDRPSVAKRAPMNSSTAALPSVSIPLLPVAIPTKVKDALRLKRGSADDQRYPEDRKRNPTDKRSGDLASLKKKQSWGPSSEHFSRDRNGGAPDRSEATGIWSDGQISGSGTRATESSNDTFHKRLESFSNLPSPRTPRSPTPTQESPDERKVVEVEMATRSELAASAGSMVHGSTQNDCVLMSCEYADLIQRCWAQDPAERPTADEVVWRLVAIIDEQIRTAAEET